MLHAIGSGTNDHYTERERLDLLLELDAAVHCDQDIVMATNAVQEIALLDASPATTNDSVDGMAAERSGEIYRQLFVKKDAH